MLSLEALRIPLLALIAMVQPELEHEHARRLPRAFMLHWNVQESMVVADLRQRLSHKE